MNGQNRRYGKRKKSCKRVTVLMLPLVLMGCLSTTSYGNSTDAGCYAYKANRPTVSSEDTVETMRGILTLDMKMSAACSF